MFLDANCLRSSPNTMSIGKGWILNLLPLLQPKSHRMSIFIATIRQFNYIHNGFCTSNLGYGSQVQQPHRQHMQVSKECLKNYNLQNDSPHPHRANEGKPPKYSTESACHVSVSSLVAFSWWHYWASQVVFPVAAHRAAYHIAALAVPSIPST